MPEPASRWPAASGWGPYVQVGAFGRAGRTGVTLAPLERRPLATLACRSGREAELAQAIAARLTLDCPRAGQALFGAAGDLVWSAPGQWLFVGTAGSDGGDLPACLAGLAAVTDQTDSRLLVAISGPDARDMLAKGLSIDLHPTVFAAGSAAVTSLDHVGVQIWQTDEAPVFRLAVPRSFAESLWSWLTGAAAEFGCRVC